MNNNKCDQTCSTVQQCSCFANAKSTDPTRQQYCARREGDRVIYCDPGCCNAGKGCPGICDVPSATPALTHPDIPLHDEVIKLRDYNIWGIPLFIICIFLFFMLMTYFSTVSLFFQS